MSVKTKAQKVIAATLVSAMAVTFIPEIRYKLFSELDGTKEVLDSVSVGSHIVHEIPGKGLFSLKKDAVRLHTQCKKARFTVSHFECILLLAGI